MTTAAGYLRRGHCEGGVFLFTADYFIRALGLEPHVEGGYCRELFKNPRKIPAELFDSAAEGERPISSTIYYLLKAGQVSKFHRLKSDELWFFHCGDPLLIHRIDEQGELVSQRLGLEVDKGDEPQITIPAGTVFGAELAANGDFCLVSCMVSPGFDFRDFELFTEVELCDQYPRHWDIIRRFNG